MKRSLLALSTLILLQTTPVLANDNPIRKTYPFSIVEVLVDKPKDEAAQTARPLPLDKIPFKQRTDKYISIGTAWFSSPKQLFSAAHVFSVASAPYTNNFYVRNMDGEVFEVDNINIFSNKYDVAAFTLKSYPKKIIPIAINKNFAIGDDVCAPGNALGEGISLRCGGQISSINPEPQNGEWKEVYFSTPVSPGNSGGPLLDSNGKAIGIVVRKITGEDLNIATPFSEMKKVKSKLEMFVAKNGIQDSDIPELTVSEPLRVTSNQAMPVMTWMKLILDSLNQQSLKLSKAYTSLWMKKGILTNKNAKAYFINPSKSPYFSQIKFAPSRNEIGADEGKIMEVKNLKRHLFLQAIGKSSFAIIENAKGEKPGALMEKPKEIMDTILASGSFLKRRIADEEILYTSFGEPYESAPMSDLLGRNWMLYRWSVKEIQYDLGLFCTARPSGVACVIEETGAYKTADTIAANFQLNATELTLGYYGTSKQWLEFVALPPSVKPKFMTDLKLAIADGKLTVVDDDINFAVPIGAKDNDDLVLSYSYGLQNPLNPALFAASYYPKSGESTILTTTMVYRGKNAGDKKTFANLARGEKPFDGNIYEAKEGQFMSSEVVSKVSDSCLVLGFFVADNPKKLEKFKKSTSFDEDMALSH